MKFSSFTLTLLFSLFANMAIAAPYVIVISEIDFSDFLPIAGSCEMNLSGQVTDFPGSQMCIGSDNGSIAHLRIIAANNIDFNIQINSREPIDGDGLTFTPSGKLTSDVDDIDIIPGQVHLVNSGLLGRIDIRFGGQIILSNASAFSPNTAYVIQMENIITWSEAP